MGRETCSNISLTGLFSHLGLLEFTLKAFLKVQHSPCGCEMSNLAYLLIVALVIRYADNILKGYATSLSIIVSAIASVYLFDFSLTTLFVAGTVLTLSAVFLYGWVSRVEDKQKTNGHPPQEKGEKTDPC